MNTTLPSLGRPSVVKKSFDEMEGYQGDVLLRPSMLFQCPKTSPPVKRRIKLQRTMSTKHPVSARRLETTFSGSTTSLLNSSRLSVSSLSFSTSIMSDKTLDDSCLDTATLPPVDQRMRVYVRIRPENVRESLGRQVVQAMDEEVLVFDPPVDEDTQNLSHWESRTPGRKYCKNFQFRFDRVFDETSTNSEVFEAVTKNLILSFMEGYNCAVFAYGATGSGKTHTMLGSPEDPGVIFFTTMELFRQMDSRTEDEQLELSISYFEIYNEFVYDLLTPHTGRHLIIQEDPKKGVLIRNLSVHQPKNADHLLEMLHFGNKNRSQHPTDANAESSRSHAIFQVFLKKKDVNETTLGQETVSLSKMSLIDLAGSEKASVAYKTPSKKSVLREGSNINKSLLALGNCINALARRDPKKKNAHIPYRDSKLTLLLRDSLGGSCHTAMIAAVSPSSLSYEDSHNTLIYANRAKGIQINPTKNQTSASLKQDDYIKTLDCMSRKMSNLEEENQRLKTELEKLRTEKVTHEEESPTEEVLKRSERIPEERQASPSLPKTEEMVVPENVTKKRKLDPRDTLREVSNKLFKAYTWYNRL